MYIPGIYTQWKDVHRRYSIYGAYIRLGSFLRYWVFFCIKILYLERWKNTNRATFLGGCTWEEWYISYESEERGRVY